MEFPVFATNQGGAEDELPWGWCRCCVEVLLRRYHLTYRERTYFIADPLLGGPRQYLRRSWSAEPCDGSCMTDAAEYQMCLGTMMNVPHEITAEVAKDRPTELAHLFASETELELTEVLSLIGF